MFELSRFRGPGPFVVSVLVAFAAFAVGGVRCQVEVSAEVSVLDNNGSLEVSKYSIFFS